MRFALSWHSTPHGLYYETQSSPKSTKNSGQCSIRVRCPPMAKNSHSMATCSMLCTRNYNHLSFRYPCATLALPVRGMLLKQVVDVVVLISVPATKSHTPSLYTLHLTPYTLHHTPTPYPLSIFGYSLVIL